MPQTGEPAPRNPLRLWPGVLAVALQWLVRFGLPIVVPDALEWCIVGGVLGGSLVIVWWAFFSRAPRLERWGAVLLMVFALGATPRILHPSIATGMMGMMFLIYAVPVLSLAFVVWAVATRHLSGGLRRGTMVAAILLACGVWALLRTNGITGEAASDFAWRWAKTRRGTAPGPPKRQAGGHPDGSGNSNHGSRLARLSRPRSKRHHPRGADRDRLVCIHRRSSCGAGRSDPAGRPSRSAAISSTPRSSAVATRLSPATTLTTGEPVWTHRDAARFWESNAGAGPRATPTLSNGRVYTFGATGILNALDAHNGAAVWSRNAASDAGKAVPEWGFASSPLVVDDALVVAVAGRLVAYDLATGKPRWLGPDGGDGYSSPHRLTIGGVPQILLMSTRGAASVAPADGTLLWKYPWPSDMRIVQPALTSDGDLLMSAGVGLDMRRIAVAHGPGGWAVQERWSSGGLKPYFNDFVVQDGYAFGFDGGILACIDVKDGKRQWKGGRYGHGQLVLLSDQHVLLVLSEEGELALVAASPGQFTEIARFPAIQGKTWNHPALAGDVLLVRNGQEMAAFRLSLARR